MCVGRTYNTFYPSKNVAHENRKDWLLHPPVFHSLMNLGDGTELDLPPFTVLPCCVLDLNVFEADIVFLR